MRRHPGRALAVCRRFQFDGGGWPTDWAWTRVFSESVDGWCADNSVDSQFRRPDRVPGSEQSTGTRHGRSCHCSAILTLPKSNSALGAAPITGMTSRPRRRSQFSDRLRSLARHCALTAAACGQQSSACRPGWSMVSKESLSGWPFTRLCSMCWLRYR